MVQDDFFLQLDNKNFSGKKQFAIIHLEKKSAKLLESDKQIAKRKYKHIKFADKKGKNITIQQIDTKKLFIKTVKHLNEILKITFDRILDTQYLNWTNNVNQQSNKIKLLF